MAESRKSIEMRLITRTFSSVLLCACSTLSAIPYQWEPRAGESAFTLDVPEGWRTWESVKKNGVIAQFRKGKAMIEVRSFATKENLTVQQIVNQKAARLASEYSAVRLLEEKESRFRENLHLSVWEIRRGGKIYREETAIAQSEHGPVVVSCLIPGERYGEYRTHCENAFYSLVLDADKSSGSPARSKVDLISELQKLYYMNIPGSLPVIAPEVLMGAPSPQKPASNPIQYDDNYILPDASNR